MLGNQVMTTTVSSKLSQLPQSFLYLFKFSLLFICGCINTGTAPFLRDRLKVNLKTSGRKRKAFWSLGLFSFLAWSWILVSTEWLGYCYLIFTLRISKNWNSKSFILGSAFSIRGIAVWDFPSWSHHWWFCVCSGTSRAAEWEKLPTDYSEAVPWLLWIELCFSCLLCLLHFPERMLGVGFSLKFRTLVLSCLYSWALGESGWPGFHYLEGPVLFNSLCPLPPCFPLFPSAAFWLSSQDQRSRRLLGTVKLQWTRKERERTEISTIPSYLELSRRKWALFCFLPKVKHGSEVRKSSWTAGIYHIVPSPLPEMRGYWAVLLRPGQSERSGWEVVSFLTGQFPFLCLSFFFFKHEEMMLIGV